ncbi:MAG: peptide-methionine (R)-S-oxide reductase MsrB [Proteobacteria bacterium]|nr:peptide-methionine (R)-S-oxide reductase MsrB [Pseudomonadota bacterium]
MSLTRRGLLLSGGASFLGLGLAGLAASRRAGAATAAPAPETFEVIHSDAEWHKILDDNQYAVLRKEGTERPFTHPLLNEHRAGTFTCAGCNLALFSSKTKFESGTGWPSFWQPLPNAVRERHDTSYGMDRTEIHCRRCGGHLGHVFDDGPKPTGLRYCMNGYALKFVPGDA